MLRLGKLTSLATRKAFTTVRHFSAQQSLIIHAAGVDRLGILSDVTALVIESGGNVGDSVAGRLGTDHFSLMMLVDGVTEQQCQALQDKIRAVPDLQSAVFTVAANRTATAPRPSMGYMGEFTLEGADHPGIVHRITNALAAHGLSIDRLETDQEIAPHGGTTLFRMRGTASCAMPLPQSFDVRAIQQELEELGDSLNCEVNMVDVEETDEPSAVHVG